MNTIIIRKAYWDYENEEKWLNFMAANGLAMISYSWCKYIFIKSDPGEYIYRIELLKYFPSHPESMDYIEFMKENGVEYVASYMKWVYFRKKAADGAFNIYSDIDSKITHYRRVNSIWFPLAFAEFAAGLANILIGLASIEHLDYSIINIILGFIVIFIGLMLLVLVRSVRHKIKKLELERIIREY